MSRETSAECYREIVENGLVSKKRLEVYQIVYKSGPMTSAEVYLELTQGRRVNAISQSRARFTELRQMDLLQEKGTKKCSVTGKTAILWDVTANMPRKLQATGKTKQKKKEEALESLRELYKSVPIHHTINKRFREVANNIRQI
jgi:hypothetical protein